MNPSRRNLVDAGHRPVIAAWLIALVVAAVLAFAAGVVQLRKLDRMRAVADSDRQLARLYTLLVAHYSSPRAAFERDVLGGYVLPGEPYAIQAEPEDSRHEEGTLFRFDPPAADGSPPSARRMVLRTTVDGSHIGPDFADWTLRLKFVDDRLAGASAASPERLTFRRPIAGIATVQRSAKAIMIVAAGVALLCLVAANGAGQQWRRQIAAIGLAGAVLTVVAANLQPTRSGASLLAEPSVWLAWMAVIGALGLAALLPPRRRTAADHPRCRCGYDLTGNISGTCPECGRPTAKGRIDRWADTAAAIEGVSEPTPPSAPFTGPYVTLLPLTELKAAPEAVDAHRYQQIMAAGSLACYRYAMTDRSLGPQPEGDASDGDFAESDFPSPPADGLVPQSFICPTCSTEFEIGWVPDTGVLTCPACSAEFMAAGVSDEDREVAERLEVERRAREVELDNVRVKQVLTERRSLFRMRSYFIVGAVTAGVAAVQLGIWGHRRLMRDGWDLSVTGYAVAIAALLIAAVFCLRRTAHFNRELAKPVQAEPTVAPDFSTLSDGSQRLDTAAQNLAKLYERGS